MVNREAFAAEAIIELKPRYRSESATWRPGEKIPGDRAIWVNGTEWGHVEVKHHGCRGTTYEFNDAYEGIPLMFKSGKISTHNLENVNGLSVKDKRWKTGDERPTEQRIIDKARELIAAGRFRDPAILKAEQAAENEKWRAQRKALQEGKAMTKGALVSLWKRPDLTNAERIGLSAAFKELFHGPIEKAEMEITNV